MISLDDAVIARYESQGHHFEIMVDPEAAWEAKDKDDFNVMEIVAVDDVYKDAKKGDHASEEVLEEVFNTTNFQEIAKKIIQKGEIQLTTEQRHKLTEKMWKQVVNFIARESVDPNNVPHPPARIEKAMEEAHVHVDPFKPMARQVDDIVDKLRAKLPLKFVKARMEVIVPSNYAGKSYGYLNTLKKVKEEWLDNGSLKMIVEIPAGMQSDLMDNMNNMTHGDVEVNLVETI